MGNNNKILADNILLYREKSGEKIAPSMGMDMAKNDKSNILSLVVSDTFCNACSSCVCPGVAMLSSSYFISSHSDACPSLAF